MRFDDSVGSSGQHPLTRRCFLRGTAVLAAGGATGALAACTIPGVQRGGGDAAARLTKEPVTLRWSAWGAPEEAEIWKDIAARYSEQRGNITASFEFIPGDYEGKILTLHVGGDAPHVLNIKDEPFPRFADAGVYGDLTDLAKRDGREIKLEDFWPHWLEAFRWDAATQRTNTSGGKLYALPWAGGCDLWFYNKDAFASANVPVPKTDWTWDDFVDTCRKVTRRTADGTIERLAFMRPEWEAMSMVWTLGQEYLYLDKDQKKCELNKPGSQFAHEQIWRLAHDWRVTAYPSELPGALPVLFADGVTPFMSNGPAVIPQLRKLKADRGWDNWDVLPMWSYKGKRVTRQTPDAITNWSGSKFVEEGWDLVKYVTGVEGQRRISDLGRSMPSRSSLARSAVFAKPDTPQHEEYFEQAMTYAGVQPVTKYWGEMFRIINKHYADMLDPAIKKKPAAFLDQMSADITTLLQTGQLPTSY